MSICGGVTTANSFISEISTSTDPRNDAARQFYEAIYLRDNRGPHRELWYHRRLRSWIRVNVMRGRTCSAQRL